MNIESIKNNLMATWFFSEKQKAIMVEDRMLNGQTYHPNFINGIEFTQVDLQQDEPHSCNFDDAVIVHQRFDLPLDEFTYQRTGRISAKIY